MSLPSWFLTQQVHFNWRNSIEVHARITCQFHRENSTYITRHNHEAKEIKSVPRRDFLKGKISKLSVPFSCVAFHRRWCSEWWRTTSLPTQSLGIRGYRRGRESRDTRKIALLPHPPGVTDDFETPIEKRTFRIRKFAHSNHTRKYGLLISISWCETAKPERAMPRWSRFRGLLLLLLLSATRRATTRTRDARVPAAARILHSLLTALCAPFPFPNILPPRRLPYATRTGLYFYPVSLLFCLSLVIVWLTHAVSLYFPSCFFPRFLRVYRVRV